MSEPVNRRILRSLDEVPPRSPELHAYIRKPDIAICVDCHGAFNAQRGACPYCSSRSFCLLDDPLAIPTAPAEGETTDGPAEVVTSDPPAEVTS